MGKRLTELLEYLDERRTRFLSAVADVSPDLAEIRPREDAWSAAVCADAVRTAPIV
jgi:hypothetical protein